MLRKPLQMCRYQAVGATNCLQSKTFKNFGHKREPVPTVTLIWHGYLTFTFIGLCINWKKIGTFIFGEDVEKPTATE